MFHGFHVGCKRGGTEQDWRTRTIKAEGWDEPHWQRLRVGCYVGFRPSRKTGKGTWFARAYDPDKGKYARKALGDYGALTGNDIFTHAKRDAEAWAEQVESGGVQTEKLDTVADACRAYLKGRPGSIAEGVFRRHVYNDPLGLLPVWRTSR